MNKPSKSKTNNAPVKLSDLIKEMNILPSDETPKDDLDADAVSGEKSRNAPKKKYKQSVSKKSSSSSSAKQTTRESNNEKNETDEFKPGVFELNFAEFPIAHLTQRLPKDANRHEIKYCDTIKGKDGKTIQRGWTIKSSAEHGLGGPSSVRVLFELLQIWKENDFADDKIHIGSYYHLLKRMKWDVGAKSYKQLKKDLESLYGLEIVAENAFYDTEAKKYVDLRYKPFIGWKEFKRDSKKHDMENYGYIAVNPDFHESIKNTIYRLPFQSEFFHDLSPHEQKLALYLTKIFNPYKKERKEKYYRNIYELCDQLPIYGTPAKQKYYLLQAAQKLIDREYHLLERYEEDGDIITFYNRQQESMIHLLYDSSRKSHSSIDYLFDEIVKVCGADKQYLDHYKWVAKNVPDALIFEYLARAKQEGNPPARLFNHLVKEYTDSKKKNA